MGTSKPVVSVIGRPNVGKSSLFNRVIGKRIAVVDDIAGVTRDRHYFTAEWNGYQFILIDTGGMLPNSREAMAEAIHEQVHIAVKESDVVLFLVDAKSGLTDLDLMIARQLRKEASDKSILAVNKAETKSAEYELDTYRALGIDEIFPVSALHGNGVADLLDSIVKRLSKKHSPPEESLEPEIMLAIVGRPNAGKSSLVNKLLGQNRMIVHHEPGTTRDSIDSEMLYNDKRIVLIDTAGLRKRSHVKQDMEYYSNLRAIQSIERCDICVLMVDVKAGIGVQDLRILRKIQELHKGVLLAWNKWDIMEKDHRTFDQLVAQTRKDYIELRFIPMVSVSAMTGQRITAVIESALDIKERLKTRVPSADFENKVFSWVRIHPHPAIPENPVRFLGAKQVDAPFPLFRFFVTNTKEISPAYIRYLTNKIYENYNFDGCPVTLDFRPIAKPKHGATGHPIRSDEEET